MLILPDIEDAQGMGLHIERAAGLPAQYISDTVSLNFEDTLITIAGPVFEEASNESSLCILFQAENCDIMITGDRGILGERILMEQLELPKLELLIVGHHGSAYSTSERLLAVTMPENAIISVGTDNPYGHPAASTLQRLYNIGCNVYRTDLNGTIIYRR
jgi:competence protein ComEC